jgi:hypothetical protein
MKPLSFKRHRFPPDIIRHAIWLYARGSSFHFVMSRNCWSSGASMRHTKPFGGGC